MSRTDKQQRAKPLLVLYGSWGEWVTQAKTDLEAAGYVVVIQPDGAGIREVSPIVASAADVGLFAAIALDLVRDWSDDRIKEHFTKRLFQRVPRLDSVDRTPEKRAARK